MAEVFRSLGDDTCHLGWHKQVHLRGAKPKEGWEQREGEAKPE